MVNFQEGGLRVVSISGYNPDVDIATIPETVWGQSILLVPPTAARVHAIVSSSANDTSAGTGARTVRITGVNSAWAEISETITLNGTSSVNTTLSYRFINEMKVMTVGSGGTSAGNITATAATDGWVTAAIAANLTASMTSAYCVPDGYTGFLVNYSASVMKNTAASTAMRLQLMQKGENDTIFYPLHGCMVQATGNSTARHEFGAPIAIPARTILRLDCVEMQADNSPVMGGFDLLLRPN